MDWNAAHPTSVSFPLWVRVQLLPWICGIVFLIVTSGCAHYPINQPLKQVDPQVGYRGKNLINPEQDNQLLLMLTFSGGGTRAAAFSYGVLETLRDTTVSIRGRQRRLLDEVDWISGVSGGSFTAAYYGLFRDRIFEDFESKFLKNGRSSPPLTMLAATSQRTTTISMSSKGRPLVICSPGKSR
ncbi:MAG: patatin-like phospholipase family protein [Syntrophobacteraceae bacterium]